MKIKLQLEEDDCDTLEVAKDKHPACMETTGAEEKPSLGGTVCSTGQLVLGGSCSWGGRGRSGGGGL